MKKYIAEFVGTFLLTFAVNVCLTGRFGVPTPVVAALTLGVSVYVLGAISGTHINPAVTLGILSVGKIKVPEAINYVVGQLAGAGLALAATAVLLTPATVTATSTIPVFIAESLGTFCLGIGVASVVFGKSPAPAAGLTIGGSLLLGLCVASSGSNAVLNPAVALGIRSLSVAYLVAPLLGSVIAFQLYRFLTGAETAASEEPSEPKLRAREMASGR